MTLSPTTFAGVSPAIAADHSRHVHHTAAWRVNSDVASRGHTTTLLGAWLDPFTVVDASVQRELVPGVLGFLSAENIGDTKYPRARARRRWCRTACPERFEPASC